MTRTLALHRLPQAFVVCAIIAGVALWAVTASGPAGASASFDSPLQSATPDAKFAALDSAPYTESAVAKRLAPTVATRSRRLIAPAPAATARTTSSSASGGLATARKLLSQKVARYPVLKGATVEFGDARGYQAISYYRSGRIVISRSHTASLERIINHEIWHVIDWRDNNRIDWRENIPPR